ncbi:MAG: hypothetical protein ABIY55_17445, partial [Kofleriaceae bacterium]
MRPSPTTLLGTTLTFDRAGRLLIAADPDGLAIIDLAASHTTRLAIRDVRAVAAFYDQLWIATHDDQLRRVDPTGRALGEPRALPFAAAARLEPAPCGPPAAIWASSPAVALIDDFGQLGHTELADADLTLPLTGRRFVAVRGAKLTLPSGVVATLAPNTTVLGGAVMADGKIVTLLVAHGGGRQLLTIALAHGQVVQRCVAPAATVRVATQRQLAVAQLETRAISVRDLVAGRELGTIRFEHDLADFAIDPHGQRLAVRSPDGAITLHRLADLLRPAARTPAPEARAAPPGTRPEPTALSADRTSAAPDVQTAAPD